MEQGITSLRDLMAMQAQRHDYALRNIADRTCVDYHRHLFEKACLERQIDLIDALLEDTQNTTAYLQMAVDHERCMLAVQQDRRIPT